MKEPSCVLLEVAVEVPTFALLEVLLEVLTFVLLEVVVEVLDVVEVAEHQGCVRRYGATVLFIHVFLIKGTVGNIDPACHETKVTLHNYFV